jgi:WD40 repeat protein
MPATPAKSPAPATPKPAAPKKPAAPPKPLTQLKLFEHDRELSCAKLSPCGKFAFAGGCDALVHCWDLATGEHSTFKGHDGWLQGLAFHPDGKRMFTLDSWGRIIAWDYATGQTLWAKADTHRGWTKGLALSADGKLLATCGVDRAVRAWSSEDGAPKGEFMGHVEDVFCVAFHPDNQSLVSGGLKGVIKHWDLASKTAKRDLDAKHLYLNADEINEVGGVRFLAFDPPGKTLAAGGAQPLTSGFVTAKPAVILFDWPTGRQRQLLQPADATPDDGFAYDLLFHPAGFMAIVTGGAPGRGALWLWRDGEKTPFFTNKELTHCRSVALHKDGRLMIAQVGRGNGGNGRQLNAKGEYEGNKGTIKLFETDLAAIPFKA